MAKTLLPPGAVLMRLLQGHLVALFTIFIWGITFISTKILLAELTAEEILFLRFLLGWLALCLFSWQRIPYMGARIELTFASAGFFGVTLYFLLENIALEYTLASNVGVLVSTAPFFTALVNWMLGNGKRPDRFFLAGFVLAIIGIIMISGDETITRISPVGDMLALLAAVAWAFYSVLSRKLANLGLGTIRTTRRSFFYGILLMLPILAFTGMDNTWRALQNPAVIGNLLFLGLGASALCFATWTFCMVRLGTVKASAYIYLVPVVTVISAAIWLHESLGPESLAGIFLVITGLLLSEGNDILQLLKRA